MKEDNTPNLVQVALREQKRMGMKGGIYHKTQIDLTYNSNHMDGNRHVGRLVMFKECLRNHIVPFIITDEHLILVMVA